MVQQERRQISQIMKDKARERELKEENKQKAKADREYFMQCRIMHSQVEAEKRRKDLTDFDLMEQLEKQSYPFPGYTSESFRKSREQAGKDAKCSGCSMFIQTGRYCRACLNKLHDSAGSQTNREMAKFEGEDLEKRSTREEKKPANAAPAKTTLQADVEKVQDRKRQQDKDSRKERHEKMAANAEKEKKAAEERQQRREKMQQGIREAEVERQRKVEERRLIEERELAEKIQRIADKGAAFNSNHHESQATQRSYTISTSPTPRGRDTNKTMADMSTVAPKEPEVVPKLEERQEKKEKGPPLKAPSSNSKELVELNDRAHKDYMLRRKEMDDARYKMSNTKKYKALAETVAELSDDDLSRRLRGIHQAHLAPKQKEKEKEKERKKRADSSPSSSRSSSRKRDRYPKAEARSLPRVMRCGLCEREYPSDQMVGSAWSKKIQRLKRQKSSSPPISPKKLELEAPISPKTVASTRRSAATDCEEGDSSSSSPQVPNGKKPSSPPGRKRESLYDYEVKLCAKCDIFVRIASS